MTQAYAKKEGDTRTVLGVDPKAYKSPYEQWKEAEGLPTKIIPEGDILDWGERVPFRVMVPKGREHVADEILRKL